MDLCICIFCVIASRIFGESFCFDRIKISAQEKETLSQQEKHFLSNLGILQNGFLYVVQFRHD